MVKVQRIDDVRWRIPREHGMRVDGIIYAGAEMMDDIRQDKSLEQVANVAHLPGILRASIAMPDIHWGYGFPIGGVAGMDAEEGVISPGGVGYDINCGVRLLRSDLSRADLQDALVPVVEALYRNIPTGVGRGRAHQHLGRDDLRSVLRRGAAWAVERGLGEPRDLEALEENGCFEGADPAQVSDHALARGADQLGTLGSGNHFVEVQFVDEIFDATAARAFGLELGTVTS